MTGIISNYHAFLLIKWVIFFDAYLNPCLWILLWTVKRRFVWVYASVQFALVVLFAHIFYSLVRYSHMFLVKFYRTFFGTITCEMFPSGSKPIKNISQIALTIWFSFKNTVIIMIIIIILFLLSTGSCTSCSINSPLYIHWVGHCNEWEFYYCGAPEMATQMACLVRTAAAAASLPGERTAGPSSRRCCSFSPCKFTSFSFTQPCWIWKPRDF